LVWVTKQYYAPERIMNHFLFYKDYCTVISFVLAFGLGANDVANTFGSSVGSGVLSLKQACVLATICEMAGAVLLGRISAPFYTLFTKLENGAATLMAGQVAALGGSCIWLLVATFLRLPVSGTHSIVGATVGFSLVIFGVKAIHWMALVQIGPIPTKQYYCGCSGFCSDAKCTCVLVELCFLSISQTWEYLFPPSKKKDRSAKILKPKSRN
uniref:Inorganic phosphate transporter n=1 Tax=Echinostoma caproni TaxID=27848 RepID=A0A183AHT7_9TREM